MPPIIIPHTARVVEQYTQHGQQRVNVRHYFIPLGNPTEANLETLGNYLLSVWEDTGKLACANQIALEQIQLTNIDHEGGPQFTIDVNPPSAGTLAFAPAPGNATHTASFRTAKVGRKYRGRNFLPGLHDGQTNDDDTVTSDRLVRAAAWVARWFIGLPTDWHLGVASQVVGATEPVTSIVFENILDSMRSRLPGRGR
jgi:hypothetical protein